MTEEWSFDMTTIKRCPACDTEKLVSEFDFRNKQKQTLQSYCKPCDKTRQAEYRSKNRQYQIYRSKAYYYANRNRLLAEKKQKYENGKAVFLERSSSYRKNNPDKVKASMDAYLTKNPDALRYHARQRKAWKKTNGMFLVTLKEDKKLRNKACFYCGSTDSIQLDHVVPLSRGGVHSIGNLVPACMSCNLSKNKWFITEWKKLKRGKNVR